MLFGQTPFYQRFGVLFTFSESRAFEIQGYFSEKPVTSKEKEHIFYGAVFMQLMYMPCYGERGVEPMWNLLQYALDHKDHIMAAML
jgi:hypothetical protein